MAKKSNVKKSASVQAKLRNRKLKRLIEATADAYMTGYRDGRDTEASRWQGRSTKNGR